MPGLCNVFGRVWAEDKPKPLSFVEEEEDEEERFGRINFSFMLLWFFVLTRRAIRCATVSTSVFTPT